MRNIDIGVGFPVVFVDAGGVEVAALVTKVHTADVLDLVVFSPNASVQHRHSVVHADQASRSPWFWRFLHEREEREANARAHEADIAEARRMASAGEPLIDVNKARDTTDDPQDGHVDPVGPDLPIG